MALSLGNLKPAFGSKKRKKRIGRGNSSGHGTYSTRGQKGQRSRSGGRKGLRLKGFRSTIRKIPKLRGFKSIHSKPVIINLKDLENKFQENEMIDPKKLLEEGLIKTTSDKVKILGQGKLTKKLIIKANAFSKSAEDVIKKSGGQAIKI